jgi:hypothetical protein
MDLLGAALPPEPNVYVAPVGRLQGRLAGRLACEDADLVALGVTQGEVLVSFSPNEEESYIGNVSNCILFFLPWLAAIVRLKRYILALR